MKNLYRSEKNKVWGGILGGLGEYAGVDPVLFRLLYISLTVFTGFVPGLIAYIVALFIVPKSPAGNRTERHAKIQ